MPIVLTTQACARTAVEAAARAIEALDVIAEAPYLMPVEESAPRCFWMIKFCLGSASGHAACGIQRAR